MSIFYECNENFHPTVNPPESTNTVRSLRSSLNGTQYISNARTGVLIQRCIFCQQRRKQFKNKPENLVICKTTNIQV